jgi:hypothetical protein
MQLYLYIDMYYIYQYMYINLDLYNMIIIYIIKNVYIG